MIEKWSFLKKYLQIFSSVPLVVLAILSMTSYARSADNVTVDILYFHATIRCESCLHIEENAKNSVNLLFEKELKDSTVIFRSLDFLEPANEHFAEMYDFTNQTLIVSKKMNGKEVKWKNLDKIWEFSNDFDSFKEYLRKEVNLMLNSK